MATKRKKKAAPQAKADKPKPKKGRPSTFTPEHGAAICEWVAQGLSLNAFCRGVNAPPKKTVLRWLRDPANEEFRLQYARAREEQADSFVDEIIDISDGEDAIASAVADDGGIYDLNRARLRIDARKWAAARLAPKKYGDRNETILKGHDGGSIKTEDVTPRHPGEDRLADMGARYFAAVAARDAGKANGHAHESKA